MNKRKYFLYFSIASICTGLFLFAMPYSWRYLDRSTSDGSIWLIFEICFFIPGILWALFYLIKARGVFIILLFQYFLTLIFTFLPNISLYINHRRPRRYYDVKGDINPMDLLDFIGSPTIMFSVATISLVLAIVLCLISIVIAIYSLVRKRKKQSY